MLVCHEFCMRKGERSAPSGGDFAFCHSVPVAGSSSKIPLSFAARGTSGICGSLSFASAGNDEAGAVP
jgi:hypothetical protein